MGTSLSFYYMKIYRDKWDRKLKDRKKKKKKGGWVTYWIHIRGKNKRVMGKEDASPLSLSLSQIYCLQRYRGMSFSTDMFSGIQFKIILLINPTSAYGSWESDPSHGLLRQWLQQIYLYISNILFQSGMFSEQSRGGRSRSWGYFLLHSDLETIQIIKKRFSMKSLKEIVCLCLCC